MIVLMMGSQGSGKGTQAQLLSQAFNLFNLDSGKFLRELAKTKPELDEIINARGLLIPDNQIFKLITDDLESHALYDDIIFDGYPRSIPQYEMLSTWLASHNGKIDVAVFLEISRPEAIRRLSARRIHKASGKVYNLVTNPPPSDIKPEDLEHREDDTPKAIEHRLDLYFSVTGPLIEHLRGQNLLCEINGEQPIEDIHKEIVSKLGKYKNESN